MSAADTITTAMNGSGHPQPQQAPLKRFEPKPGPTFYEPKRERTLDLRIIAPARGGFIIVEGGQVAEAYSNWVDLMIALKTMFTALPGEEAVTPTDEQLREFTGQSAKRGAFAIFGS